MRGNKLVVRIIAVVVAVVMMAAVAVIYEGTACGSIFGPYRRMIGPGQRITLKA